MPASKPKLAQLTTPVTATFPSELSALSAKTPLSAVPDFIKEEFPNSEKTPITPPLAYMDFLRSMSRNGEITVQREVSALAIRLGGSSQGALLARLQSLKVFGEKREAYQRSSHKDCDLYAENGSRAKGQEEENPQRLFQSPRAGGSSDSI
ncbi:hypothetical protein DL767_009089 [Monosporascus sp. MG133]|nr:hypothetical protein DL767_009089 [Monosporascus sp. MG133]